MDTNNKFQTDGISTMANELTMCNNSDTIRSSEKQNPSQIQPQIAYHTTRHKDKMRANKLNKRWNRRLRFFFCCLGYKKNKDSFADVASIFADFFHDLDSTSSEFIAGFVTLSKFQKAQREWKINNRNDDIYQYLSCLPISSDTKFLDVSEAGDSHLLNELIYYLNYSLAIFGWPLHMIDDPCALCCIYPYLRISPCCGKTNKKKIQHQHKTEKDSETTTTTYNCGSDKEEKSCENVTTTSATQEGNQQVIDQNNTTESDKNNPRSSSARSTVLDDYGDTPIIIDDNCCGCNAASVERRLASHNYEIIYVTYHVEVSRIPFLVAADHSKQTIVVAMRGSMSLDDVVTDMNGQIDKLPIKDCPDDWLCHRGISRASNYVKNKLIEDGILQRAFDCRPDLDSQDYNLVLCGHSLGAGAAAILGILLRDQYPDLKAYLYSPPGGILSLPVVEYTKQFATGIILGNDCVPRLGVAQFERLRYHVYLSLKNSQASPATIITKTFCCCTKKTNIEYDPDASIDLLHGSHGSTFEYRGVKIQFQIQPHVLYVPGRILHIVKNYSLQSRATRLLKGPVYQAVWVENTTYDRIMIATGMFCDHLPNNLMHAMKMLFVNTLPVRKNSKSPTAKCSGLSSNETPQANHHILTSSCPLNQQKPSVYNSVDTIDKPHLSALATKYNVIKNVHDISDTNNNNNSKSINYLDDNNNKNNIIKIEVHERNDNLKAHPEDKNNNTIEENKSIIQPQYPIIVDNNGNNTNTIDRNHLSRDIEIQK